MHLNVKSAYSLCQGAIRIEELPKLCKKFNMPAVAVADKNNLFGAMEFCLTAAKEGIQPIIGCDLDCVDAGSLILLVQSHEGYQNLIKLVSHYYLGSRLITLDDLSQRSKGLIAIAPLKVLLEGPSEAPPPSLSKQLKKLKDIYQDRFYLGLTRHDTQDIENLDEAYEQNIPIVALNDVHFSTRDMFEAHDVLMCISSGRYAIEEDRPRLTEEHYFKSLKEMSEIFEDLPEAIENTVQIAKRCHFMLEVKNPVLPPYVCGMKEGDYLKQKALKGLQERFGNQPIPDDYQKRLQFELQIIDKMGFSGYFLIVSDFIQWAKSQNIPVGPGRGSGAGSIVAWSLKITNVDPIKFQLLFERFLNPERLSMPDFDIDFCQDRRDEVITYVREKYGDNRVAHIITFGKLQARAVLRDVGRVLQIPYPVVDKICKMIPNKPMTLEDVLLIEPEFKRLMKEDPHIQKLIEIGIKLEGLYRHASTHAAGVVIGGEDLENIVPLYREEGSNISSTQFSMKYVELSGLLKFDFLGLRTLTVIEHCSSKIGVDINQIPLEDAKTFELLGEGKTIGVFQVEGAGMKEVILKLQPDKFEDLIALISLYRPGPMDDIPKYLARKHGEEPISYLHPKLEPILKTTYGVMVYQEQVMQIAQSLGGYSMGKADLLRRAMGKKIKSEMDSQREVFVDGATNNGVDEDIAIKIFDQMAKFSGYGFNKSHAAPYALLTYLTAYLKAHYPEEFFASIMTYDTQNTDKLLAYYEELKRMDLQLLPPSVNHSSPQFVVENGAVRYGFSAIKNLGENTAKFIKDERERNGPYKNLKDFFERLEGVNKRQIEYLCQSGALDELHPNRAQIYCSIDQLTKLEKKQQTLFKDYLNLEDVPDWDHATKLEKELEAFGFYLTNHPLDDCVPYFESLKIEKQPKPGVIRLAGIVKSKKERISKSGKKFSFVGFSSPFGDFEVLVFDQMDFEPLKPLIVTVHVKDDMRMICNRVEPLEELVPLRIDPRDESFIDKLEGRSVVHGEYRGFVFEIELKKKVAYQAW